PSQIINTVKGLSLKKEIDVIITTGGTGLTGRDNTIDNIKSISEIEIPGFGELFRQISFQKIGTSAIQSRSSAFLVNKTYVFCLPGSKSAVQDAWKEILFYQLDIRHKPCNFVELIPRLDE
ncbi:MAG: molybdopterin-binding protein, partial [Alphaproteobacteria bacterium]|nr:molybdopterin-binding protein [Alphaproteobacteria bacterium]